MWSCWHDRFFSLCCITSVMNAEHIEGGLELSVPVSRSRIMWLIPLTCYTQNVGWTSDSQNNPLANAWGSWNVGGFLEIIGPSFYMLSNHMWCGEDDIFRVTAWAFATVALLAPLKKVFLTWWPWTLTYDLDLWTWPRYPSLDLHAKIQGRMSVRLARRMVTNVYFDSSSCVE